MKKDSKKKDISRRNFIKNVSSGVLGTGIVLQTIPACTEIKQEIIEPPPPPHEGKQSISVKVNHNWITIDVEPQTTLVELLRDYLDLTGTKVSCNHGECGACTVILDGKAVYSCHMLAIDAHGKEVISIEGLMDGEKLHPVQEAFLEEDGYQCGFCTPGQIMSAYALLINNPNPSDTEIREGMSGNLCRCAAYPKIAESVKSAAKKM
jgi:xanthine dehydrogenase YagT iron-sulfur-binding subunit